MDFSFPGSIPIIPGRQKWISVFQVYVEVKINSIERIVILEITEINILRRDLRVN
jgi:hypothetical protein